jgi:monofunctional biosynthetic peptidoglycan transglycosylase
MPSTLLFDFTSENSAPPTDWCPINDDVMGGVSESTVEATEGGLAFTGTVSLDHGGGFASVRAPESVRDLSAHNQFQLHLRGDGRRYWFTTYTVPGGPISYRVPLQPPTHWTTVDVSFSNLTPYRRGSKRPDAPSFDPSQLRTLGFLIADGQAGPFRLEVAWIRAGADDTRRV